MNTIPQLYIVGAGIAGHKIYHLLQKKSIRRNMITFLDDDHSVFSGKNVHNSRDNIEILGPIEEILKRITVHVKDEMIIAMPGLSSVRLRQIYYAARNAGFLRIRILPPAAYIFEHDTLSLSQLREIQAEDIIPLQPIHIEIGNKLKCFDGKRILITGAGGSIGSESARQLLYTKAETLFLLGHGEESLHTLETELQLLAEDGIGNAITKQTVLGDLKDSDYMNYLLTTIRPDIILHTAAYKHAPMLEDNAIAAIENNVLGTRNLLLAAEHAKCERIVFMSTDKAVNPSNVYGASKLLAERIVLNLHPGNTTRLAIRCGNILASRGSVTHKFKRRIACESSLSITSPEAKRFFMTISEATSLLLNIAATGTDRGLYIMNMKNELFIEHLAEEIIRFYNYEPGTEIPLEYSGLRKGEKKTESIKHDNEQAYECEITSVTKIHSPRENSETLNKQLECLKPFCKRSPEQPNLYRNAEALRQYLKDMQLLQDTNNKG